MSDNDVCEHQNANYLRMMSERDEAQRQVADLRAGIEALRDKAARLGMDEAAEDANVLLAGSGEQAGEVEGYCTCHDDQRGRTRDCGVKAHREAGRPTPVVPDVVRELDAVMHHHADRADAAEAEADRLAALLAAASHAVREDRPVDDGRPAAVRRKGGAPDDR